MTIGSSINGCSHSKSQFDERKQGWLKSRSSGCGSLRARCPGCSGGGAKKGGRACNYVSGIWIPPPFPLRLPVDCTVRFPPISAKRKWARMYTNIEKHVPKVMTSLLMSSPPISISHRLFRCRHSNSRDAVASCPSFSRLAARAPGELACRLRLWRLQRRDAIQVEPPLLPLDQQEDKWKLCSHGVILRAEDSLFDTPFLLFVNWEGPQFHFSVVFYIVAEIHYFGIVDIQRDATQENPLCESLPLWLC